MSLYACLFLLVYLRIHSPSSTKTGYWSKIYHWSRFSYHKSFHVTLMSRDRVIVRTYIKLKPSPGWKPPGKCKPLRLPKFQYLKIHVPHYLARSSSTVEGSPTPYTLHRGHVRPPKMWHASWAHRRSLRHFCENILKKGQKMLERGGGNTKVTREHRKEGGNKK